MRRSYHLNQTGHRYSQDALSAIQSTVMDSSSVLNVVAVAVSVSALSVSLVFAVRQTRIMRQSNQVPLFVDLIQEFRSKGFQDAEQYILHKLRKENSPEKGVLALPDQARFAVTTIQS